MGLRFRRSITLAPGVKMNFGKTGVSVSAGVPGFRKTIHSSGKVTTSMGIPGTGIYYVDTENVKKPANQHSLQSTNRRSTSVNQNNHRSPYSYDSRTDATNYADSIMYEETTHAAFASERQVRHTNQVEQLDAMSLKSIHKACDDTVDWTEVLVSPLPPDNTYDLDMWRYYHDMAPRILSGDIDAYLQLIYEVNPLDDLLAYGSNFEFGTDNPDKIEVEFTVNAVALDSAKKQLQVADYNDTLQDYICSVCIRIAREMFALLPISHTMVHTSLNNNIVLSVDFDRTRLSRIKFGYIDPSDTLSKFTHRMSYDKITGFTPVVPISENVIL